MASFLALVPADIPLRSGRAAGAHQCTPVHSTQAPAAQPVCAFHAASDIAWRQRRAVSSLERQVTLLFSRLNFFLLLHGLYETSRITLNLWVDFNFITESSIQGKI